MHTPKTTRLFYDSEFTGLHQHSTLISLALVSEDGREFYAEFSDFDPAQCDAWLKNNVFVHTRFIGTATKPIAEQQGELFQCYGAREWVRQHLQLWLEQFTAIEIWADCLAYDWVLFCELFGGALQLPQAIFYMPFDLVTLFKCRGIHPDISRSDFAGLVNPMPHNALSDARTLKACYKRLQNPLVSD